MNKSKIKTFAIWARQKLMDDVRGNASLIGITEAQIDDPLSQSTSEIQYFDIGTNEPYALSGDDILKRDKIVVDLKAAAKDEGYKTAYMNMIEHTASTWFNRIAAIRFMEVNDYFDDGLRVLSSVNEGSKDSDLMIAPFESDIEFTEQERQSIIDWKLNNNNEELFELLLQKKCIRLGKILPGLFSKDTDPTVLLMNFSITDQDSVIWHFTHDIEEADWKEAVEIIGWLYQYYNTEPKDQVFAKLKKNVKITKDNIPAATQLFTPDWIVKYMVENSLGRLWIEGHPDDDLKSNWRYYFDEAKQEPEVEAKLEKIKEEYAALDLENITFIDPCMGSGHILSYAFDVLMQIYKSQGYTDRDAVRSIIEKNLYGIDIDERAYQIAYFAIMMKGRQYDRGFFRRDIKPNVIDITESNGLSKVSEKLGQITFEDAYKETANYLINAFKDAREYGSILDVEKRDYNGLAGYLEKLGGTQIDLITASEFNPLKEKLHKLIKQAKIMSSQYDVVVTNPPYMGSSSMNAKLSECVKVNYKDSKSDLFAVFIEKCARMLKPDGLQAMITQHAWMFLSSFEKLREKMQHKTIVNMAHLGPRAFEEIGGEVVQVTTWIQRNNKIDDYTGVYERLVDYGTQDAKERAFIAGKDVCYAKQANFGKIPGAPIAYWVSENVFRVFENKRIYESVGSGKKGLSTGLNDTFLRLWFEVNTKNIGLGLSKYELPYKWIPLNKGGSFRKWYGNNEYVIEWFDDGRNVKSYDGSVIRNPDYYFKESITWTMLSASCFGVRYSGCGKVFEGAGPSLFVNNNVRTYILALLCSKVGDFLIRILNPTININIGDINNIPVIVANKESVDTIANECIYQSKSDWDSFEISWDFIEHPLIRLSKELGDATGIDTSMMKYYGKCSQVSCPLELCYMLWQGECNERFNTIKANEEELNHIFIDIYGLQDELTPKVEDKDVTVRKVDLQRDIKSLISYAVGCIFGRYSLDVDGIAYAGGEWNDEKYKTFIPDEDNCIPITDENYFSDDIVGRFVEFIRVVYGEVTLEENLRFVADALGGNGEEPRNVIRKYFLNDFFKDHCKTYSVTGSGKRPIYWLFDSGKQNGFKALVYMHRWNGDTIATVRASYVAKVQEKYENELRAIELQLDHLSDPRQKALQQKRKEKIVKQVAEIKQYDELISHLALEHIDIDLDDGVKVNHEKVQHDKNGDRYSILAPIK
jgi:hypothetical protein